VYQGQYPRIGCRGNVLGEQCQVDYCL